MDAVADALGSGSGKAEQPEDSSNGDAAEQPRDGSAETGGGNGSGQPATGGHGRGWHGGQKKNR